jgi:hypothetical protein
MNIPASFWSFPQRPFVFKDIPASFLQKRISSPKLLWLAPRRGNDILSSWKQGQGLHPRGLYGHGRSARHHYLGYHIGGRLSRVVFEDFPHFLLVGCDPPDLMLCSERCTRFRAFRINPGGEAPLLKTKPLCVASLACEAPLVLPRTSHSVPLGFDFECPQSPTF